MTFPSSDVGTTNTDAGTKLPSLARANIWDLMTKFNQLRSHVSTFMQGVLTSSDAAATRTALGVTLANIGAAASGPNNDITSMTALTSINGAAVFSRRNLLINGDFAVCQRRVNLTLPTDVTAVAAPNYNGADHWYAGCTGSAVKAGMVTNAPGKYSISVPSGPSSAGTVIGQRIESTFTQHLQNAPMVLSFGSFTTDSPAQTLTWAVYTANSKDAHGTLTVPTRTLVATGTVTMNTGAYARNHVATFNMPNTTAPLNGIQLVFSVGTTNSNTNYQIGEVQLEVGTTATAFERVFAPSELALCSRYFEPLYGFQSVRILGANEVAGTWTYRHVKWYKADSYVIFTTTTGLTGRIQSKSFTLSGTDLTGVGTFYPTYSGDTANKYGIPFYFKWTDGTSGLNVAHDACLTIGNGISNPFGFDLEIP